MLHVLNLSCYFSAGALRSHPITRHHGTDHTVVKAEATRNRTRVAEYEQGRRRERRPE